ncbi:YheC/YheD family protein [Halalkalibacterium halodurans]|uniref:YheC/D like ATP-grasp n=1 Tax=Halalkalibacterium halodurans TaxID=86665 RepID=A0A0M0KLV0_ALKHA|nr:YheC/YheD family protein [Halalkalibacterium halodurans]MDY7221677.1 YheC/YheD family protein [Halalkalibacterium halodurans]MDY7240953.1 YheC/YheD family protein [Halalkalibacterium halodurans]TPE70795.1 YheC/YheD family protein [Halalkalibacterium halodurans]
MIQLVYNGEEKRWGTLNAHRTMSWGHNKQPVARAKSDNGPQITLSSYGDRIGPLIGLLTSAHKSHHFSGNKPLFSKLAKEVAKRGGCLVVFTPEDVKESEIEGYCLKEGSDQWIRATFPYPNMIYNKIPSRTEENKRQTIRLLKQIRTRKIPYFNPHFFNKWSMFEILSRDPFLRSFLPATRLFSGPSNLLDMLGNYKRIYLKPTNKSQGKGVFTLEAIDEKQYLMTTNRKQLHLTFPKLTDLLLPYTDQLILQQAIRLRTYQDKPYDYRIHMHKLWHRWHMTGIGVRLGKAGSITTHVPQGGSILSIDQLPAPPDEQVVKRIGKKAAMALERAYGPHGECSLDIGEDQDGGLWLFEVNAKPMTFDEPSIQRNIIQALTAIFFEWSGFHDGKGGYDEYHQNDLR